VPTVHVPAALRSITGERDRFEVEGETLGAVFSAVFEECPALRDRVLLDGELRPDIAVAIDGSILEGSGLVHAVAPGAEIYLVPPIGGGARAPAGYSGTPLVKKLGLKPGMRALFVAAPEGYGATLGPIPDVRVLKRAGRDLDFIQLFVEDRRALERRLPRMLPHLAADGMLWVSWPKKSSPLFRDLTEDGIREAALAAGVVDVKVCAVDDDWSGLKLVYRLEDRARLR
jgi:molybdopterin converting factor small subunit